MLYSIVAVICIIIDQAVKYWVSNTLFGYDIVKFIPGVISLVNVHNDGAAFSFLSGGGARIYFIVITAVFTILVIIALATNFISGRISRWALVFVTAGGLGNCIDRIIYGYVQDMFKVELFDFAIFNVADIFITVGALVFVLAMIFEPQPADEDEDEDEIEEEPKPARERKALFSRVNAASRDFDDDEDDPRAASAQRKTRRNKYEKEYEEYKAQRSARERAEGAAASRRAAVNRSTTVADSSDPFAEWDRANSKADSERSTTYASRAMGATAPNYTRDISAGRAPIQRQRSTDAAPSQRTGTDTGSRRQSIDRSFDDPALRPQAPSPRDPASKPAPAPAARKSPAVSDSDFSLDDILNEFK